MLDVTLKPLTGTRQQTIHFKEAVAVLESLNTFVEEHQYYRTMHLLILHFDEAIGTFDIIPDLAATSKLQPTRNISETQ